MSVRLPVFCLVMLVLSAVLCYTSLRTGSFNVSHETLMQAIFNYNPSEPEHIAVHELRLPRMLMALLAGAALAFSGYLMQVLVSNPLADPYTLGTASGAALGANIAFGGLVPVFIGGLFMPPFFAFIGAIISTTIVMLLAKRSGGTDTGRLLLGGIAVSALLNSLLSLLTFMSDSEGKLRTLIFWLMGSFDRAQWAHLPVVAGLLIPLLIIFTLLHKHLTLMLLGEDRARLLGLNLKNLQLIILAGAALATAVTVSVAGVIGFAGLLVPHAVRGMFGVSGRWNLMLSAWLGGLFMVGADTLARMVFPPAGIPVGIVTSFAGIPFFVYLLWHRSYRFN
ncbi:MAG: iron ABC transporter permease [Bacteroidota bacterium]